MSGREFNMESLPVDYEIIIGLEIHVQTQDRKQNVFVERYGIWSTAQYADGSRLTGASGHASGDESEGV